MNKKFNIQTEHMNPKNSKKYRNSCSYPCEKSFEELYGEDLENRKYNKFVIDNFLYQVIKTNKYAYKIYIITKC